MRYNKRKIAYNNNQLYREILKARGVKFIDQYTTPILKHPNVEQTKALNLIHHIWSPGDKYYKLAHNFYNNSEFWWIIAWFNKRPTESHIKVGDVIFIPLPLGEILKVYGLYY